MDPITFEVIRNALVAATDEMVLALKRSAYSTNIKTRSDFSCAFFDAQLRSVAQGFAQPVQLPVALYDLLLPFPPLCRRRLDCPRRTRLHVVPAPAQLAE